MSSKTCRRFALCAEFGAGKWRMVFFFPLLEERLVRPFSGAQQGKWFEQLADGQFKLVEEGEERFAISLEALDKHICLKVRLPVCIIKIPQTYIALLPAESNQKFICSIDPKITGDIHFDVSKLERQEDEAYVSLTSFNAPIEDFTSNNDELHSLKWSIRSINDFIPQKPKPPTSNKEFVQQPPRSIEEGRHKAMVVCWKLTKMDSFFLKIDDGQVHFERIQANNSFNRLTTTTKLGQWYRTEYSRYKNSNTHVLVHNISEANVREILFQTRIMKDGIVQFKVNVLTVQQRGNSDRSVKEFQSSFGAIKILEVPQQFKEKQSFHAWCTLSPKQINGYTNRFMFAEEIVSEESDQHDGLLNLNDKRNKHEIAQKSIMDLTSATNAVIATAAKTNGQEYREDNGEEEGFEDEVTIQQPELLGVVLERAMTMENTCSCRVELSTECKNAIKITGVSKEAVKECAKWIRKIRNDLMKSKPLEESTIVVTNSVELTKKSTQEDEISEMKEPNSHHNTGKDIEKILTGHPKVINWLDEVEKTQESSSNEVEKLSAIANNKENYGMKQRGISIERTMSKSRTNNNALAMSFPPPAGLKLTNSQSMTHLAGTQQEYRQPVMVPKKYHGFLIGNGGTNLDLTERKFNVKIYIPPKLSASEEVVIIGTNEESVNSCKQQILKTLKYVQNDGGEKWARTKVPAKMVPMIVGKDRKTLNKIETEFPNVSIYIPRPASGKRELNGKAAADSIDVCGDGQHNGPDDMLVITYHGVPHEVDQLGPYLEELVNKIRHNYITDIPIPLDDPNHTSVQFIKFLRGSHNDKIRDLNQKYPEVKVQFPSERDKTPLIKLFGPLEKVLAVKDILQAEMEQLKSILDVHVPVDCIYHDKFLRLNAKLLKEIQEEHRKCMIHLNRDENNMLIRGRPADIEKARQTLEKILEEMNEFTCHVSIASKYHHYMVRRFSEIREKYSVICKIDTQNEDQILLNGPTSDKLKAAENTLLECCPVTKSIEIAKEHWQKMLYGSRTWREKMEAEYEVHIIAKEESAVQAQLSSKIQLTVEGQAENVRKCLIEIGGAIPICRKI